MRVAAPAALIAALLLAAAAACSSSGHPATVTGGATTGTAGSSDAARLQGQLLALGELPAGWSAMSTGASSPVTALLSGCPALDTGAWHLSDHVQAEFQHSADGTYLLEDLATGPAAQQATAWSTLQSATSTCQDFTTGSGASTIFWAGSTPAAAPAYADTSSALFLEGNTASSTVIGAYITAVRKGPTLARVIVLSTSLLRRPLADQLTGQVVTKIR